MLYTEISGRHVACLMWLDPYHNSRAFVLSLVPLHGRRNKVLKRLSYLQTYTVKNNRTRTQTQTVQDSSPIFLTQCCLSFTNSGQHVYWEIQWKRTHWTRFKHREKLASQIRNCFKPKTNLERSSEGPNQGTLSKSSPLKERGEWEGGDVGGEARRDEHDQNILYKYHFKLWSNGGQMKFSCLREAKELWQ